MINKKMLNIFVPIGNPRIIFSSNDPQGHMCCHHLAYVVCKLLHYINLLLRIPLGQLEPILAGMFIGLLS